MTELKATLRWSVEQFWEEANASEIADSGSAPLVQLNKVYWRGFMKIKQKNMFEITSLDTVSVSIQGTLHAMTRSKKSATVIF